MTLGDAARGSAAVPLLFPSRKIQRDGVRLRLIDGGMSRTLPVANAFDPPIGAQHVLAVKVSGMPGALERSARYFRSMEERYGDRLVVLEIPIPPIRALFYSEADNLSLVQAGEGAVSPELISRIRAWL